MDNIKYDELKPGDIINLGNSVPLTIILKKVGSQIKVAQFIDYNYMVVVSEPTDIHRLKIVDSSRDEKIYKSFIKKVFEYDVYDVHIRAEN